ncbi:MAG: hypothetical protein IPG50_21495 [Myxococcales bacterium]|nr:hypothetical protein [Myxococcales bacterium]
MTRFPLVLLAAVAGCKPATAEPKSSAPVGSAVEESGTAVHGVRRRAQVDAPVVVDGKLMAFLRFGEVPATLAPTTSPLDGKPKARYYRLGEYLAALGVDVARVRAVHVGGNGHRFASIEGTELRREPNRFLFDFRLERTGIPRTGWWTSGLKNTFRVDEIRQLLVYVDRAVPALHAKRSCYAGADDRTCSEAIPYLEGTLEKGTRLYLDGRLVGQVKRRRIGADVAFETSQGGARYDLGKLLQKHGVAVGAAASVELTAGDDLVARATGAEVLSARVSFGLPNHQHGRIVVGLPAAFQAPHGKPEERDVDITAVSVTTAPARATTQRALVAVEDASSLASADDLLTLATAD